jgi:hypothetical protein
MVLYLLMLQQAAKDSLLARWAREYPELDEGKGQGAHVNSSPEEALTHIPNHPATL